MTKTADTDLGKDKITRLDDLNVTLLGVENDLMGRALSKDREELERVYDFINKAAEDGIINIDCDGCDDDAKAYDDKSPEQSDDEDKKTE